VRSSLGLNVITGVFSGTFRATARRRGTTPAVAGGRIWVRDWAEGNIIVDLNGKSLGSFAVDVRPQYTVASRSTSGRRRSPPLMSTAT